MKDCLGRELHDGDFVLYKPFYETKYLKSPILYCLDERCNVLYNNLDYIDVSFGDCPIFYLSVNESILDYWNNNRICETNSYDTEHTYTGSLLDIFGRKLEIGDFVLATFGFNNAVFGIVLSNLKVFTSDFNIEKGIRVVKLDKNEYEEEYKKVYKHYIYYQNHLLNPKSIKTVDKPDIGSVWVNKGLSKLYINIGNCEVTSEKNGKVIDKRLSTGLVLEFNLKNKRTSNLLISLINGDFDCSMMKSAWNNSGNKDMVSFENNLSVSLLLNGYFVKNIGSVNELITKNVIYFGHINLTDFTLYNNKKTKIKLTCHIIK